MHQAFKRYLACVLSASMLACASGPAFAGGVAVTTAYAGAATLGNGAVGANLGAMNAVGTTLQGASVMALQPILMGGLSVSAAPTLAPTAKLSVAVAQPAAVPTASERAAPSVMVGQAAPAPLAETAVQQPAVLAAPAGAGAQTTIAAPDSKSAAEAGPAVRTGTAQDQLEKLAKETQKNLAKGFDDAVAGPEAAAAAPVKYGKLGRTPSLPDARTLTLAKYMAPELPGTPDSVDFSAKVKGWGMMLNDNIGDCTVAACGHEIQQWTANAGQQQNPADDDILSAYEAVSGYKPGQANTDRGADMLTVLKYWRKVGIAAHKIGAFASVDPANVDHIRAALWIFGSVYLGLNLPVSAQKQDVWDVPAGGATADGEPGSWGGHAVEIAGFGPKGVLIVTWGALKWMTWDFLKTYGGEAYAIISQDFLVNGKTPNNGFDMNTLKADLKAVTDEASNNRNGQKK
jgi:hypothetical protein